MKRLFLISLVAVLLVSLILISCGLEPPATPTGLNCTAVSYSQIDLSWDASTGATGYHVYRCNGTSCTPTTLVRTEPTTSWSNTGLTSSTTYRYMLTAYNEAGESGYSSIVSCTTPPATPTGLNCTAVSYSQIDLSWDASTGATGYHVYRCNGTSCTPTTLVRTEPTTSWSNTGLTSSTTYRYRLTAYNEAGESGYSSIVSCTTDDYPQAPRPKILVGVPYPYGTIQGIHLLDAAQMAASEINVAGVYVSGENTTYDIQIIGRNDNEISDPANAWHAVNYLVNTAGVDFVIGGIRTEAVIPMITNVFATASPRVPFFICGSSTQELLAGLGLLSPPPAGFWPKGSGTPYYTFNASTSDFYEYIFRVTPFNSGFLVGLVMTYFAQLAQDIQTAMGWGWNATAWPHKVKVAIVGENLTWAAPVIASYQYLVAGLGPIFGWELNMTRTFSDNPPVAVIDAALTAIESAQNVVILTCMSGPCGLTFGKRMGALNISAIPVGINVEAQDLNYHINSAGGANYELTTNTYAQGVNNTAKTAQFLADYATYTGGWFPIYTASSYDMVYALAEAIVGAGSRDKGAVCTWLRTHCRTSTSANTCYYPDWDMVTVKKDKYGRNLPALNNSQIAAIYGGLVVVSHNKTMPPYTTNDLIYGPGYATGLGVQWINGTQVGVYPNSGYDAPMGPLSYPPQTTLQAAICGIYWSNALEYPGIVDIHIPAAYQNKWSIWYP